jgi:hypothetical protein
MRLPVARVDMIRSVGSPPVPYNLFFLEQYGRKAEFWQLVWFLHA